MDYLMLKERRRIMIKVIRPRTRNNVECANCGALLSYEKEDIETGFDKKIHYGHITCPECGEEIRLVVTR